MAALLPSPICQDAWSQLAYVIIQWGGAYCVCLGYGRSITHLDYLLSKLAADFDDLLVLPFDGSQCSDGGAGCGW